MAQESEQGSVGSVVGGHYEIVEQLVDTTHSQIFWARNLLEGGQDAAIKVAVPFAEDPFASDRLNREGTVMALLQGTPAAPKLLDRHYTEDGHLLLAVELLDGMSLTSMLQRGDRRLPLEEVVSLFGPVVETLSALHRKGIIHRNLHPGKLFRAWDPPGLRLLGFGDAIFVRSGQGTRAERFLGLPQYVAPEVWFGAPEVDERSDVYSLATILYRCLAGRCPFENDSAVDLFDEGTRGAAPPLTNLTPGLPADLDDWAELALCQEREGRFHTVEAMWNAFVRAAQGSVAPAREIAPKKVGEKAG